MSQSHQIKEAESLSHSTTDHSYSETKIYSYLQSNKTNREVSIIPVKTYCITNKIFGNFRKLWNSLLKQHRKPMKREMDKLYLKVL